MTRSLIGSLAAAAALALVPATVQAKVVEIGNDDGSAVLPPACPAKPCLAMSKTTGFQAKVGAARGIDVSTVTGRIVAWTVTLGNPGTKQTAYFDQNLGGAANAQITVLDPRKSSKGVFMRAVAQGDTQLLQPYFGQTTQFPLLKSIPVVKGQVIALTTTTWAPVLAVNQPGTSSWRGARTKTQCTAFDKETAQTTPNELGRYDCLYRTARLTYSATVVTTPTTTTPAKTK